jgi:hypothetical protein
VRLRRGVVAVGLLLFGLSGGPAHAAGLTPEKVFPDAKSFVNIDTAFSPNGWGIVGWTEQVTATKWQLEVATRPPGGDWSEPTPLGATEDHNTTSPHVAINDSGAAAATWVAYVNGGGSPNVLYVSTRPAGGSFTQPESVSGQYSYGVGIDGAGNVDLLYRIEGAGPDNGAYVKTVAAGSPFAPATAHEFGNGCTAEAIATSPGGDAAVAFGCSGLDFAVRHNGTWTESYPFTNTYPNCPGSGNSTVHVLGGIAIDPAGVPAAIVQRTDSQHDCSGIGFDTYRNTIFLVTLSAGALAGGGTVAQGPTVAFFGSRADDVTSPRVGIGGGQVVASWIQADQSGAYHPMVRTYASNGAASPGAVEAVPGALQTNVAPLAVSNDGSALLAFAGFIDSTHLQPYLATRPPAGPPGAPVAAGPVTSNYGGAIAIDASASGDGLLAYTVGDATAIGVRARGWDATAPELSNVSIPGTATAGTPVAFGAQASDIWGPVSFGWNFGDGSDSGASPSHSFAAAGPHAVTVTATDGAGNSSSQSGTVDVASALAPGPPGGLGTPAAPVLSRLSLSARTFRVGAKSTAISAKARKKKVPTGTKIRFQLDQAATVAIKIERALPGRKRGKRCVAPTKKLKRAKRCTRYVKAGTLTRRAAAGADKVAFSGRIGKKALKPGRYRMKLVATAANATGPAKSITFKIVR